VLDLAIRSVGSKLQNGLLTLLDARGVTLESDAGFDGADRFIAYRISRDGTHRARVADQMLGASNDHFYRLSIGALSVVTSVFPLSVQTNAAMEIQFIGVNLTADAKARVKTMSAGEVDVPIDGERFRARRAFKVVVADAQQLVEQEPNDRPDQATTLPLPGSVNGLIRTPVTRIIPFRGEGRAALDYRDRCRPARFAR
jgi:hypothetical protein